MSAAEPASGKPDEAVALDQRGCEAEPAQPDDAEPAQPDDREPAPDLRLLPAALAGWVVTAATLGTTAVTRVAGALVLVAVLVVVLARYRRSEQAPRPVVVAAFFLAAAVALCLGAAGLHSIVRDAGSIRALAQRGAAVRVEATVVSDPRTLAAATQRSGRDLVLVELDVAAVEGRGRRSLASSRVLVFGSVDWSRLHWGERIRASGRLAPSPPGDDVVATLSARGPPELQEPASGFHRLAERVRAGLRAASAGLAPDPRGLLPGLVVGDTSLQPPDLVDDMKATGLTHLSAVSGTNITIVCVLALALGRAAGLGRRWRLWVAALVLVGFVVLARPEPSVLRAAVMGLVGLLAVAGARRRAGVPALSTAVLVLLVCDPWLARSYGFALSVLATLGLLLLARPWTASLSRRLPRWLAAGLAIPLAAQAVCGPVVVLLSGQVSLVALPANLLVAPMVAPATVLGLAAALLSLVSAPAAQVMAVVAGWPCSVVTHVARWLADVPGGQVAWLGGPRGAVSLAAVTALLLLVGPAALRWSRRRPLPAAGCLAVAIAAGAPLPGTSVWPPTGWVAVACDVGQGDAMVLSTGPGRAVLVDAGPAPQDVDRCLTQLDVHTLDAVVLTHFHADHVDGLPGAVGGRRVGAVLITIVDDPPAQARAVRAWAASAGVPVRVTKAGEQVAVGPLRWETLWPARVVQDGSVPNNASVVLRVEVAGLSLLLTGDIEPAAARAVATRLAQSGSPRAVDVLKVAHHGSAKQDPGLLAQLSPRLALISVGADNEYGHPADFTLRLLRGLGATVARTDQQGDLAVVARRDGLAVVGSGPQPHADVPVSIGGD